MRDRAQGVERRVHMRLLLSLGVAAVLVAGACVPARQHARASTHTEELDLDRLCAAWSPASAPTPTTAASASSGPPAAASAPASCPPPRPTPLPPPTGTIAVEKQPRTIRVHVLGPDDPFGDCLAHPWVVRTVAARVSPVDAAVRAAIGGPTPFEAEQGLRSPFVRSTSDPAAPPLSPSQVKVTVKDGTATVDFAVAAAPYLHQAACARSSVTSAIEHTLLQFREIQRVQFSIGGTVIEEWDA
jgi:hypothetical protein